MPDRTRDDRESTKKWLYAARTISEALPYMRRFAGKTFVIKYGGHAMGDAKLAENFANDVVLLKQVGINPIVVHGGGPQIGKMLDKLRIESEFVDGLRVTDADTVHVVEMVLSGSINKGIVGAIIGAGGNAVGLSGKDGKLVTAHKLSRTRKDPDSNIEQAIDLGFVGEPGTVDPSILNHLTASNAIPVIAPVASGEDGQTYNINADTFAGAIAGAMNAAKLLMLTDVPGIKDKTGAVISATTPDEAEALIADGTATGGMIPKIETCVHAVRDGAQAATILDGRIPHVMLLEVFTEAGVGTQIRPA